MKIYVISTFVSLFVIAHAATDKAPTAFTSVPCKDSILRNVYAVPISLGTSVSKMTLADADTCSQSAIAGNNRYFAISLGVCYVYIVGIYSHVSLQTLQCASGFMDPKVDIYENLRYRKPKPRKLVHVISADKEFVVLNETSFNYFLAIMTCDSLNLSLAEVSTQQHINDLNDAIRNKVPHYGSSEFWLHMDKASGRKFLWRNSHIAVPLTGKRQNWALGNPINSKTKECVAISGMMNLEWVSESCSLPGVFPICEKFIPTTSTTVTTASHQSKQNCQQGYKSTVTGDCEDIDECLNKPCGIGWCHNIVGSYHCECLAGAVFNTSSNTCEDVNECLNSTSCVGGQCKNLVQGYQCICKSGYKFNEKTRTCEDLDECATNQHLCHFNAECSNLIGGYECTCKKYYQGDGFFNCQLSPAAAESFKITCHPNRMQITVDGWVIDNYGSMTLRDTECTGVSQNRVGGNVWVYMILNDLSNCDNTVINNGSHVTYTNVLSNNRSVISENYTSGAIFQAPWSCTFKIKNLHSSLSTNLEQNGTGFIDFQLGKPNDKGLYADAVKGITNTDMGKEAAGVQDIDSSLYGGEKPDGIPNKSKPVIVENVAVPGLPFMTIKLPNGTVYHSNMSEEDKKTLLEYFRQNDGGIEVKDDLINDFLGLNGTGLYRVKMLPFTNDKFNEIQPRTVFSTKEMLYLRVALLTNDLRLATIAQRCWGTPEPDPLSRPSLDLIVGGCAVPGILQNTVKIFRNGIARTADFQTQVFKFNNANLTYFHCSVDLCDLTKEDCKPDCNKVLNRKRRSSDTLETQKKTNLTVNIGPYHVKQEAKVEKPSNPVIIVLIITICVLTLIVLTVCCCCIFLVAGKRRKKKRKQNKGNIQTDRC